MSYYSGSSFNRGASQPAAPRHAMTLNYRNPTTSTNTSSSVTSSTGLGRTSYGSSSSSSTASPTYSSSSSSGMGERTYSGGPYSSNVDRDGHTLNRGTPHSSTSYLSGYGEATQRVLRAAEQSSAAASKYHTSLSPPSSSTHTVSSDRNPLAMSSSATSSYNHSYAPSAINAHNNNGTSSTTSTAPRRTSSTGVSYRPGSGLGTSTASSSFATPGYHRTTPGSTQHYIEDSDEDDGPHISLASSSSSSSQYQQQQQPPTRLSTTALTSSTSSSSYSTSTPTSSSSSTGTGSKAHSSIGTPAARPTIAFSSSSSASSGPTRPPAGLRNIGNTCYMNSALQCTIHASGTFLQAIMNRSTKLAKALNNLAKASNITDLMAVKSAAAHLNHEFHGGRQNDSHEFLRELIHAIHLELNRISGKTAYKEMKDIDGESDIDAARRWFNYYRSHDDSIVTDYFGGFVRSATVCAACSKRSLSFNPVWDLSLSMGGGAHNVPQMIKDFMRVETLSHDSAFTCEKCKKKKCTGKRQSLLVHWPKVLVLHFCRFTYSGSRNSNPVEYPAHLGTNDIPMPSSGFVQGDASMATGYTLSGVILHKGTASFGHYVSMVRPNPHINKQWYECDDSIISPISESSALRHQREAYVLFYVMDE